jgi:hypothetical protein
MAEMIACLTQGKVELLVDGQVAPQLQSPYLQQQKRARLREARVVSVTRGRTSAELCYAIGSSGGSGVFLQTPGTHQEQRVFQIDDAAVTDLDFSRDDRALVCTVAGARGTSAIGLLADDGKGVRTVTEGDVVDRAPRWVRGGRREVVYASAGIGRTKSGAWVGLAPSALHQLRFADSTVEVLMADAQYDYLSPVTGSEASLYALRRAYLPPAPRALTTLIFSAFRGRFRASPEPSRSASQGYELVRISTGGTELVAASVTAYDVAPNGDVVYSTRRGVFRIAVSRAGQPEAIASFERVQQIVIC